MFKIEDKFTVNMRKDNVMNCIKFRNSFEQYYREYFSHWRASSLVKQEQILSQMIDSDFVHESILIDEIILLYDIVRDECVKRLAFSVCDESE